MTKVIGLVGCVGCLLAASFGGPSRGDLVWLLCSFVIFFMVLIVGIKDAPRG